MNAAFAFLLSSNKELNTNNINDHYELTTDHNDLKGYDVLLITRTKPTPIMKEKADNSSKINSFYFKTNNKIKKFNIYILKNWK